LSHPKTRKKTPAAKSKSNRSSLLIFAVIIIAVLLVAGYVISQPPNEPAAVGEVAPDFTLPIVTSAGVSNQTVTLSSFRGSVVVLEFMLSSCHFCQQMQSSLAYIHFMYRDKGVVFLSVAGTLNGATAQSTAEFIRQYNSTWTHVLDSDNAVFAQYKVQGTPTYLILDKDGKIVSKFQGLVTTDAFTTAINLALS
jgi:thiol-disulfide isomerase/thioredoxin